MARQNWRDRRRMVETTVQSMFKDTASLAAGTMVASILDQLDSPAVVDNDQALIFAMSCSTDHQTAACDWFIGQSLKMIAASTPQFDTIGRRGATIH